RHQVVVANRALVPALEAEQALARREARLLARERGAVLLSDRLAAQKDAVQAGYRRDAAAARVAGLRATLTKAEAALQQATLQAQTASGPHLHLQLDPATSYPQNEAWFQQFAGVAFSWQDAATPAPAHATGSVFAVVPSDQTAAPSDGVVKFTRVGG